jgi:hypothetical protein
MRPIDESRTNVQRIEHTQSSNQVDDHLDEFHSYALSCPDSASPAWLVPHFLGMSRYWYRFLGLLMLQRPGLMLRDNNQQYDEQTKYSKHVAHGSIDQLDEFHAGNRKCFVSTCPLKIPPLSSDVPIKFRGLVNRE